MQSQTRHATDFGRRFSDRRAPWAAETYLQSIHHQPQHLGTDVLALAQRELTEVDHHDEAADLVLRVLNQPVQRQQDGPVDGRQGVPEDGDGRQREEVYQRSAA